MLLGFTLDSQVITVVGNVRLGCEMRNNDKRYLIDNYYQTYYL